MTEAWIIDACRTPRGIAQDHPIGAILINTLLNELERRDLKRGLVTMCAADGMAPAVTIERL